MNTMWQPICASLDDSLALLSDSFGKLQAAQTVDINQLLEQLTVASNAARNLNSFVASVIPSAEWQNREDLNSILAQIDRIMDARAALLNLASELKRGVIVHRRALRIIQVNQLREQAIIELQSYAQAAGVLPTLPGPEAEHWIEWACSLRESEDAETIRVLRSGFIHLDNFIANLEPNMWVVGATTLA